MRPTNVSVDTKLIGHSPVDIEAFSKGSLAGTIEGDYLTSIT
jgi:hypothetical protein